MTPQSLKARIFSELESLGFHPADSLPLPEMKTAVRPPDQVAARLMSPINALFTWVASSEDKAPTEDLRSYIARNGLRDWLTQGESVIIDLPRADAHECHVDTIGWKLENMWALAWVIGFELAQTLDASQIGEEVIGKLFQEFLPSLDESTMDLLAKTVPRAVDEVVDGVPVLLCSQRRAKRPTRPENGAAWIPPCRSRGATASGDIR